MFKMLRLLLVFVALVPSAAQAILSLELTRGLSGAIPITVIPFAIQKDQPSQDISKIIATDLKNSGRFKVISQQSLTQFPSDARDVATKYFRKLGTDNVVVGKIESKPHDQFEVSFQLLDLYRGEGQKSEVLNKKFLVPNQELRAVAHHISDLIYEHILGVRGVFATKIAYVLIQHSENGVTSYKLEVADQDGYNPRPLLTSYEPIMSPAWSPNGKEIAYVSFENRHAAIYIQEVTTGTRRLLSEFPGINGAPAWSPDGKKLALVLSKTGSPNIYIMDIASKQLTPVTKDFYLNTEPVWSADGKSITFTSDRSGGPQIYQIHLGTGQVSRLSYDGDYNTRPSFTQDGRKIAMIHRVAGIYNIALLNLNNGRTRVLTSSNADSASPSIAPNGTMILYDTIYKGKNVLGMVSADGRIQLVLPARDGEAQDPAWSPFLS